MFFFTWTRLMLSVYEETKGLGCAEEQDCINDIDFLVGTFGKQ